MTAIIRAAAAVDPRRLSSAQAANRSTAGHWDAYDTHRAHVCDLILRCALQPPDPALPRPANGLLCLLGAGNCNDVDLRRLAAAFHRVHLIDIDSAALADACRRQPAMVDMRPHGDTDLSCLSAAQLATTVGEPADVVVSTAVLSQLVADAHDRRGELTAAELHQVRERHLSQMAAVLRQGGWGLLINDLVSSATVPELGTIPAQHLPGLLRALIQDGNFFTGANPYAVCAELANSMPPDNPIGDVVLHPPWVWHMGRTMSRLTYAITFRRLPRGSHHHADAV